MSADFKEYALEALAAQKKNAMVGGPFGSNLVSKDYTETGIPVIRGQNMGKRWVSGNFAFVSQAKAEQLSTNTAHPGDLVFTQRGTLGQVSIVPDEPFERYIVSQSQMKITVDPNLADAKFLYYYFSAPDQIDYVKTNAIQTGVPHTNLGILRKSPVLLPSLDTQKRIAKILSGLDDKIELNHQINQTLEQMAQAIFKSWFVDFEPVKAKVAALEADGSEEDALLAAMQTVSGKDEAELTRLQAEQPEQYAELRATAELFPSAMQESELVEIPEGWECLALDQIAKYQNGLALQKFRPENEDDYLPVVKIAQLKKGYADHEEKASPNIKPDCIIDNGDVVFSWSGSLMVDTWCGGRAALNQHLFKVTSENYPKWLYFHFTRHHLEEFQRIAADKAVTMGHIKREHLKSALCAIPDGKFIESAGKVLSSVLNKQIELRLESKYLSELRDALLPKLLSGELSVSETANQTLEKVEPTNV
ncbi:restriction endonuclease subunit S [Marinobacter sp. KM021]|uniref:restriction endonuclease subunit S n=1 Tax=Marinobacter sp. KM021 TaxID=3075616 RepID=UPI003D6BDF15